MTFKWNKLKKKYVCEAGLKATKLPAKRIRKQVLSNMSDMKESVCVSVCVPQISLQSE